MSTFDIFKRLFGAGAQERREKPRVNARDGTRVLIVDDSSTIVALLRKMLRQSNYITLEAGDAESGIEIARAERPDLMFLDIVLPGMNGFSALRILRRDPATKNTPIIMMSGNEQATEQFYAQRIGADDFMKKPFSRSEVFARIDRLLDSDMVPKRAAFSLLSETPNAEAPEAGQEPAATAAPAPTAPAVPAPAPVAAQPHGAAQPHAPLPQSHAPQSHPQPVAPMPTPALAAVPSPVPPQPLQPQVVPVAAPVVPVTAAPRAPVAPAPRPIAPAPSPYPWSSTPRPAVAAVPAPPRPAYAPPVVPIAPRPAPAAAPAPTAPAVTPAAAVTPEKPSGSESQG